MNIGNSCYFSVIIPLYNKSNYIERAINSVLLQTYPNFEIIIVDDGSTDDGIGKVKFLNNKCIKVFSQKNQGVARARNVGVKNASFEYVAFLDADDTWENMFLKELNSLINRFPNCGIYGINHYFKYTSYDAFYDSYDYLFDGQKSGIIKDYFNLFAKNGKSPFSNSGCCFPKKYFFEFGGYHEGITLTEDSDLWCKIAIKYEVAFFIEPLVTYYLDTTGNTHLKFEPRDFQVSITLRNALYSHKVKPNFVTSVQKLIAFQQLSLIKRAILTGNQLFALRKFLDWNLLHYRPGSSLLFFFVSLIPTKLLLFLKQIIKPT